jgi:hypothetical protein
VFRQTVEAERRGAGWPEKWALTLGAEKEREELRLRLERGREEVAMGTDTIERVAIFALLSSRRDQRVRYARWLR